MHVEILSLPLNLYFVDNWHRMCGGQAVIQIKQFKHCFPFLLLARQRVVANANAIPYDPKPQEELNFILSFRFVSFCWIHIVYVRRISSILCRLVCSLVFFLQHFLYFCFCCTQHTRCDFMEIMTFEGNVNMKNKTKTKQHIQYPVRLVSPVV